MNSLFVNHKKPNFRYTASWNNLHFLNPHPGLPRWGRELKENAVYNRLEYINPFIFAIQKLFARYK